MVKLDSMIGDVINISFRDVEVLKGLGINNTFGHYILRGYDQLGLWLQHPGIIIKKLEDENGQPLTIEKQTEEEIEADFIVKWDNIATLMHYPGRQGFDFPDQYKKKIGFKYKKK